jgi:hypothetical protein
MRSVAVPNGAVAVATPAQSKPMFSSWQERVSEEQIRVRRDRGSAVHRVSDNKAAGLGGIDR